MKNRHLRSGNNVKEILRQFSFERKINKMLLDYRLVSFETYLVDDVTHTKTSIKNSDIGSYIDSAGTITQEYTIDIFRRKSSFYPIVMQIQANDTNTELRALIYTQRFPKDENLENLIKSTIFNICAYRGIIIGLGWNNINPSITDIASKLRNSEILPEYYEIHISSLREVVVNSAAVMNVISKSGTLSNDSFLLNGGFFKVAQDEVLLIYRKPIYDSAWRNIFGGICGVGTNYPIGIDAGSGIDVVQENDAIVYKARMDGYVSIVGGSMVISDTITLGGVNAKNIADIEEQNIESLIVKNDNPTADAISSGLNLDVRHVRITGNVGAALIDSNDLYVNGQVRPKTR